MCKRFHVISKIFPSSRRHLSDSTSSVPVVPAKKYTALKLTARKTTTMMMATERAAAAACPHVPMVAIARHGMGNLPSPVPPAFDRCIFNSVNIAMKDLLATICFMDVSFRLVLLLSFRRVAPRQAPKLRKIKGSNKKCLKLISFMHAMACNRSHK
jgi:hypothetical protein